MAQRPALALGVPANGNGGAGAEAGQEQVIRRGAAVGTADSGWLVGDQLMAADGIELSSDVLDRIDQIVPPAVTINVADNMWNFGTTALDAAFRRR